MCDYCSWIEKLLHPKFKDVPTIYGNILDEDRKEEPKPPVKYDPTVLVHGTADSASTREEVNAALGKIENAAVEAYKELAKGCEAVEAVEVAIRGLETVDEKNSDSGRTSINYLTVTKDAAMMDSESNAGSVGAIGDSPHPISLAKKVLRETDHVLIVDSGARKLENSSDNLALRDEVIDYSLPTPPNSRVSREEIRATKTIDGLSAPKGVKIYGAVARDRKGRLACGISTTDDREESVAKSSITASGTVLGCGIFADAESCCSVSGEDRAVYLHAPARKIVQRLRLAGEKKTDSDGSVEIEDLLSAELTNFSEVTGESCVGAAVLRVNGKPEVAFTSRFFPWAACIDGVVTSGCVAGEVFERDVGELDMPLDCRCD